MPHDDDVDPTKLTLRFAPYEQLEKEEDLLISAVWASHQPHALTPSTLLMVMSSMRRTDS